ncbi:MAG: ATP-binding protein [Paludibacter sp.]|nr:ATP-binding protein [Paludibacter sp.]
MSIESKIRFKAIILYLVAGIAMTVVCLFIYGLRNSIIHQREEIEKQHQLFTLTNELVYAVGKAQISAGLYISTNNTEHINQLAQEIKSVDSLITLLSANELIDKNKIQELNNLLSRQAQNLYELNRKFGSENPVDDISKRIKNYEPQKKDNVRIVSVKQDSIFKASERKNLMQRIREVFNPAIDSTLIVINQSIDTFKIESSDSLAILTEVDKIAQNASKRYELNIRAIEQQLADLVIADRQISSQVSTLLIELHANTLNSVIITIEKSEKSINRNYTFSIIGGILALGLILLFIVLIIYDVNKGKKAREKLKQVMESRHHLLLSVSHDIKSPLGSILGHLELFEKQGENVHSMKNSARHILALLENLMEYSSLEQGTLEPTFSGFDPGKAGEEIVEMFLPITDAKGLTLKFNSDTIRINSDAMKIKQIIINLVSNAIKYTSRGEVCLEIHVNEEKLLIDVKDTGAGIPADKLNEIFKPFMRLESNNTLAHGSGYGMYVVKGLIDLLGGTINILSEVGKGTLIKVEIPVGRAVSVMKNGKKRIAVYEDDPVMAKLVSDMLHNLGHSVVEQDYEVILTDMEMGDISGLDILAAAGDVPVILMTGRGDFSAEKALKTGFLGFLSKPVSMDDLREVFGEGDNPHEDIFNVEEDEEIMEIFRSSTLENFTLLKQALGASDYAKAQSLCHKMLPMFAQLGYPTDEFRRMDAHRAGAYEGWQADVEKILTIKV